MSRSRPSARTTPSLVLLLVAAALVGPARGQGEGAQEGDSPPPEGAGQEEQADPPRTRKLSPFFEEKIRGAHYPNLPRPPLSPSWDDPEAVARGSQMIERLLAAAGGWQAFQKLGGLRYDCLVTVKVDTHKEPDPWRVHHYEPRLCHFDVDGNGYVYTEYARPTLTGPDMVREVLYGDISWREMRSGYLRSLNARRTAWASVRLEELTGLMPFSLRMLDARLAFVREEHPPEGTVEVYAMQLADPLVLNHYPMMVDEYGFVDEFLVFIRPEEPRVVQLGFAFPDEMVKKPPHMRWWFTDFEGSIRAGEECILPHKRFRWLEGFDNIDEYWVEDVVVEPLPPRSMRRPWQTEGVYDMPYRCDFWDPPEGVQGLSGHGTGVPHPRPGDYTPDHPRHRGGFPPLDREEAGGAAGTGDSPR